jgi:Predicted GTPases
VSDNPLIYLLDTPGILTPNVQDVETGLRLALCGKALTFLHYARSWVITVVWTFTNDVLILQTNNKQTLWP